MNIKRDAITKRYGRKSFKVLERELNVGDFYEHEEVVKVQELELERCLHSDDDAYVYYLINTTINRQIDEDPEDIFICVYVGY